MAIDPTPRTFREVGLTFEWVKGELDDIKKSIDDMQKGQKHLIALLLTSLIMPVLAGIILALILGGKK